MGRGIVGRIGGAGEGTEEKTGEGHVEFLVHDGIQVGGRPQRKVRRGQLRNRAGREKRSGRRLKKSAEVKGAAGEFGGPGGAVRSVGCVHWRFAKRRSRRRRILEVGSQNFSSG